MHDRKRCVFNKFLFVSSNDLSSKLFLPIEFTKYLKTFSMFDQVNLFINFYILIVHQNE